MTDVAFLRDKHLHPLLRLVLTRGDSRISANFVTTVTANICILMVMGLSFRAHWS
jgi:hypothetical protein